MRLAIIVSLLAAALFTMLTPSGAQAAGGPPLSGELKTWTAGEKPEFVLDATGGPRGDLAAQRGRIVVVHFFATWCAPCRVELPALGRFAARWAGRPVTVLAISVGEDDAPVHRFLAKSPLSFPVLLDRDRKVTKAWGVKILPTTYLLDAGLAPRFVIEQDYDWDAATIDDVLNTLASTAAAKLTAQ